MRQKTKYASHGKFRSWLPSDAEVLLAGYSLHFLGARWLALLLGSRFRQTSVSRTAGPLPGPPVLRAMRESRLPQRQLERAVRKM